MVVRVHLCFEPVELMFIKRLNEANHQPGFFPQFKHWTILFMDVRFDLHKVGKAQLLGKDGRCVSFVKEKDMDEMEFYKKGIYIKDINGTFEDVKEMFETSIFDGLCYSSFLANCQAWVFFQLWKIGAPKVALEKMSLNTISSFVHLAVAHEEKCKMFVCEKDAEIHFGCLSKCGIPMISLGEMEVLNSNTSTTLLWSKNLDKLS